MEKTRIKPFLTFNGKAEEALNFYAAALPGAKIGRLERYGKESPHVGAEDVNKIMHGSLVFMGQEIIFLDMSAAYPAPEFSWASSIYIDCQSEAEFDAVFGALSQGGSVMMGPESVGPIRKCAWVTDKFGVTWQPVWE